jgi:hypothetical protein
MKMTGFACVAFDAICGAAVVDDADDAGGCDSRERQPIARQAMTKQKVVAM